MSTSRRNFLKGVFASGFGAVLAKHLPGEEVERVLDGIAETTDAVIPAVVEDEDLKPQPHLYTAGSFVANPNGVQSGNVGDLFFHPDYKTVYVCKGGFIWEKV